MKKIITINRMYGSNGRNIGRALAAELGIHFYDRELLKIAGERKDIPYEELVKADEKRASLWRYPVDDPVQMLPQYRFEPINDILFAEQRKIIKELAEKEDCIIVGRCANDILRYQSKGVFVYAPMEFRVATVMERAAIGEKEARTMIKRMDKERKYYYNYYTDERWDDMGQYDLCLDGSRFTVKQAVRILCDVYESMEQ